MVSQEVLRVQQDWELLDDPVGSVYFHLEEVEEDVGPDAL